MLRQEMLRQGMPLTWLCGQDRQSRELAFFISTAKSASDNSIDVPRESFNKSKTPPSSEKKDNKTFEISEYIFVMTGTLSDLFEYPNDRICGPSLGRRLHSPVYLVCLPYQKA